MTHVTCRNPSTLIQLYLHRFVRLIKPSGKLSILIMDPSSPAVPMATNSSTLYPSIGKLKDFLYEARKLNEISFELIGTVKLHGTHADIVIDAEDVIRFQSRNQTDLRPEKDNEGFATFAGALEQDILALKYAYVSRYRALNRSAPLKPTYPVVIAGEFCGGNIQKKVALLQLKKQFVIVSVNVNNTWLPDDEYGDIHNESIGIYNISRAGFFYRTLELQNPTESEAEIDTLVKQVEQECPYARTFGASGIGEGIVWKPRGHSSTPTLWFKSKGEMFAVAAKPKRTAAASDNNSRVKSFAEAVVTEIRMEQGWGYLKEMRVARNMKGLGKFLKWVVEDCLREEKRDMEEADIKEQNLKPAIVEIARLWYKTKVDSVGRGATGEDT